MSAHTFEEDVARNRWALVQSSEAYKEEYTVEVYPLGGSEPICIGHTTPFVGVFRDGEMAAIAKKYNLYISTPTNSLLPHANWNASDIDPRWVRCPFTGGAFHMIKRHFRKLGYSIEQVRDFFAMTPEELPTVAPAYAATKRKEAFKVGLGHHHNKRSPKKNIDFEACL